MSIRLTCYQPAFASLNRSDFSKDAGPFNSSGFMSQMPGAGAQPSVKIQNLHFFGSNRELSYHCTFFVQESFQNQRIIKLKRYRAVFELVMQWNKAGPWRRLRYLACHKLVHFHRYGICACSSRAIHGKTLSQVTGCDKNNQCVWFITCFTSTT